MSQKQQNLSKATKSELLQQLYEPFANCQQCPLGKTRPNNVVFGAGNPDASVLFIGEAPGNEEDIQGQPFVGRSGQLLTKVMDTAGIKRPEVYITNIVKCRPPQNRMPAPNEANTCMNLLLKYQIKIINPKIICTLGSCALNYIAPENAITITKIHGKILTHEDKIIIPLYHPAYILRNKNILEEFVNDMYFVSEKIHDLKNQI